MISQLSQCSICIHRLKTFFFSNFVDYRTNSIVGLVDLIFATIRRCDKNYKNNFYFNTFFFGCCCFFGINNHTFRWSCHFFFSLKYNMHHIQLEFYHLNTFTHLFLHVIWFSLFCCFIFFGNFFSSKI